ncbi:hypothetical protein Dimus_031680, partial [Dionaea muscipula]
MMRPREEFKPIFSDHTQIQQLAALLQSTSSSRSNYAPQFMKKCSGSLQPTIMQQESSPRTAVKRPTNYAACSP